MAAAFAGRRAGTESGRFGVAEVASDKGLDVSSNGTLAAARRREFDTSDDSIMSCQLGGLSFWVCTIKVDVCYFSFPIYELSLQLRP